jgi:DNA-binding NarL/FixJ family response regulator
VLRIFLADDSVLILDRLQELLGNYSYIEIVGSCNNGIAALEMLRKLKPDLAIVDIKMPGITGLQVLTEIRKEDILLKFMILTFYSNDYHLQIAMKAGADYFFSKADDFEKIQDVITELIAIN